MRKPVERLKSWLSQCADPIPEFQLRTIDKIKLRTIDEIKLAIPID
jgi:hypothetical protein